jgi:predicted dehydrogenase
MAESNVLQRIRIGLVGAGAFGRVHLATIRHLAEAVLTAVVDRDDAKLRDLPDGVSVWTDLESALAADAADAWIVACTTEQHIPITERLLQAGATVLLEKPLALDLAEAQRLAPHVLAGSANLMLGHVLLFNSEFRALQQEVTTRGRIRLICCYRMRPATELLRYPGESPFHLTMVHDLYCVQALMGGRDPVAMTAQQERSHGGDVDVALAQLRWADGTIATFTSGFVTPPGLPEQGFDRMEVYGEGWAARLLPNPRPIQLWDDKARSPLQIEILTDSSGATGMLAEQQRRFCRVVGGEQSVPIGARYEDGLQVLRWLDQLEQIAEG